MIYLFCTLCIEFKRLLLISWRTVEENLQWYFRWVCLNWYFYKKNYYNRRKLNFNTTATATSEEKYQPSCCSSCGNNGSKKAATTCNGAVAPPHETCIDCNEKTVFEWMCKFCTMMNMKDDPQCIMCSKGCSATLPGSCNQSKCGLPGCVASAVYYGFCGPKHLDKAVARKMLPRMIDGTLTVVSCYI